MHVVTTYDRFDLAPTRLIALASMLALVSVPIAAQRWGVTGVMVVVALAFGGSAAIVDARSGRIPDRLVLAALVPILAVVTSSAIAGTGLPALGAVALGGLAFGGPVLIVHVVAPSSLGFGDVKLAAALGAALGLIEPGLGLLALCVASAATAAVGLMRRRRSLPFGPGLVLGATIALLIAGQLGEEASRWR
jgi:leader peptidase (prepilin peptidase)/N-methyltransferase